MSRARALERRCSEKGRQLECLCGIPAIQTALEGLSVCGCSNSSHVHVPTPLLFVFVCYSLFIFRSCQDAVWRSVQDQAKPRFLFFFFFPSKVQPFASTSKYQMNRGLIHFQSAFPCTKSLFMNSRLHKKKGKKTVKDEKSASIPA